MHDNDDWGKFALKKATRNQVCAEMAKTKDMAMDGAQLFTVLILLGGHLVYDAWRQRTCSTSSRGFLV